MPPNPKRMSGKDVEALRKSRGETMEQFGAYMAKLVNSKRPYTKQEVNAWEAETNGRKLPMAIEMALLRKGDL